MHVFQPNQNPDLLIGLSAPDDAAVYRVAERTGIISTVDFFPPVVDDPFDFGAIAAANALSDVYAMGGEPLMAINLAAFPDNLSLEILSEILRGGATTAQEAGMVIAGGHTVTDQEPKYGLAVTGRVDPERIVTKGGVKPGDALILTKPLGTGIITTAHKQDRVDAEHLAAAVRVMRRLNKDAARIAVEANVHAMTDITGYSLVGHVYEMALASGVTLHVNFDQLQWLRGVEAYAKQGISPGGTGRNRVYFEQWVSLPDTLATDHAILVRLYDPQTSGGLLMAIDQDVAPDVLRKLYDAGDNAFIIGHAESGVPGIVVR
jgi:selenide,water dikinase